MHTTLFHLAVPALALAAGSSALAAPNRFTQPLHVQAAARPIAGLSAADRASLPDATTVQLAGGRVATLGTLRTEHLARMAQFAGVARVDNLVHTPPQNTNIVLMKPPTTGPADYLAFCAPLRVSGCLYFPPNTFFTASDAEPTFWQDDDPLLTDAGVCQSDGGVEVGGVAGCRWSYPASYGSSFDPGLPPSGQPIGYGVTWVKNICNSESISLDFHVTVDPKGALRMTGVNDNPNVAVHSQMRTDTSSARCVVSVYVPAH